MLVGTAGHTDHGKTTLVKALTGVDTDRLPEEKKRGISIELGYAFLDAADGSRIGFIDMPGHARLVHTMLAGATGIDFALLLVAADEGPMPQTLEHLAVLSLLGVARGAVVVTKCDRVEPARVQAVCDEAAALLRGTPLQGVPVLAVSAHGGEGLAGLRQLLFDAATQAQPHPRAGDAFRLAVDRAFTLDGVGTVATGTVHAGRVALGDELCLVPGDRRLRVHSLHAQNRAVREACAGQRCAVGLVGVERDAVERGQWLVAPAVAAACSARIDVELTLWQAEPRPLRTGASVHVHLGAASVPAKVAVLEPAVLEPGGSGRVQLVLARPLGVACGDRVVLRDAGASRTLAGGRVLDPFAPQRHRRTPLRLAELDAWARPTPQARLSALLAVSPQGVDLRRLAAAQGGHTGLDGLATDGQLRHTDAAADVALGRAHAAVARARVLQALAAFHAAQPDELGPEASRLRRLALPRLSQPLWHALLDQLLAEGSVKLRSGFVHLPAHGVRLSAAEERIAQKVGPRLAATGFEGAWVRDLARDCHEPEPLLRVTLARLAQRGELHQVVKDLYLPPATLARAAALVRGLAAAQGGAVTAAAFRDATQVGRRRAIQLLEHFDRIGLLRRVGDEHRLRGDSRLFLEAEAA